MNLLFLTPLISMHNSYIGWIDIYSPKSFIYKYQKKDLLSQTVYQLFTHLLLFVLLRHKRCPLEITAKLWCMLAQDLLTGTFQLI